MSGPLIACGISGCSIETPSSVPSIETPSSVPVQSLQEIRRENVVTQQWDLSCGAAALATVLTYQHGDPTPEATIISAMLEQTDPARVNERGGFSLLDLKRFADSRGYVGVGYAELTSENLGELAPIIVPITVRDTVTSSFFGALRKAARSLPIRPSGI
jgi:predicted double-glycine peptidase